MRLRWRGCTRYLWVCVYLRPRESDDCACRVQIDPRDEGSRCADDNAFTPLDILLAKVLYVLVRIRSNYLPAAAASDADGVAGHVAAVEADVAHLVQRAQKLLMPRGGGQIAQMTGYVFSDECRGLLGDLGLPDGPRALFGDYTEVGDDGRL
jgi:hypothetical protein